MACEKVKKTAFLSMVLYFGTVLNNAFYEGVVIRIQQVPFQLLHKERSNVVLVLLHNNTHRMVVHCHCGLKWVCKQNKLLVVRVRVECLLAFQALNDELETGLDVLNAHAIGLFLKLGELWLAPFDSLFALVFDQIGDFLPTKVKVMGVKRIEKPILDVLA